MKTGIDFLLRRKAGRRTGIDLDESAIDFINPFLSFLRRKHGININYNNLRTYNLWENGIGRNREEAVRLVDEFYSSSEFDSVGFIDGARENIIKLAEERRIYFITSRPLKTKEKTAQFIQRNLAETGAEVYHSGDFHSENGRTKAEICRSLRIDEMVEDNLEYARQCSRYVGRVFLLNRPWNQENANLNGKILRVENWQEILEKIRGAQK